MCTGYVQAEEKMGKSFSTHTYCWKFSYKREKLFHIVWKIIEKKFFSFFSLIFIGIFLFEDIYNGRTIFIGIIIDNWKINLDYNNKFSYVLMFKMSTYMSLSEKFVFDCYFELSWVLFSVGNMLGNLRKLKTFEFYWRKFSFYGEYA